MITFQIKPSSIGKDFNVNGFLNSKLITVINNFILNQCPIITKINAILCEGNSLDMNKTLLENKLHQGSIVVLMTENVNRKVQSNQNINQNISITPLHDINQFSQSALFPNRILTHRLTSNNILNNNSFPIFNQPQNNLKRTVINPLPQIISQNFLNPNVQKCINFLINGCNISSQILDLGHICVDKWVSGRKSGPPGYEKIYYPPIGWIGIGLKVLNLYDNGDNAWLENRNLEGEWYIAYHPIKTINSISSILNIGFRRGLYQRCKNEVNLNPLTKIYKAKCGEGVYFIPDIKEAIKYTYDFNYLGDKFKVVLMCKLNPYKVRISKFGINDERWIVNGDKLDDPFGRKRDDEVRPSRILLFLES